MIDCNANVDVVSVCERRARNLLTWFNSSVLFFRRFDEKIKEPNEQTILCYCCITLSHSPCGAFLRGGNEHKHRLAIWCAVN